MLVTTFFQQVLDNNSLETLLWHFVRHFCTVCCHNFHGRVYRNIIRLIKAHLRSQSTLSRKMKIHLKTYKCYYIHIFIISPYTYDDQFAYFTFSKYQENYGQSWAKVKLLFLLYELLYRQNCSFQ